MLKLPTRGLMAVAMAGAFMMSSGSASAIGLVQAYNQALQNDPTFSSAKFENAAGRENKALARAGLLPNVSASYSANKNKADITPSIQPRQDYSSSSANIQLRQPILNLENVARYYQGVAQSNYSDAQFSARRQDLILRLVSAYIEAQFAEDQLRLSLAQRDTLTEQKNAMTRMFTLGEATKTDILETQAKFDINEAQILEAQDNLMNARNALAAIIGTDVTSLDPLSDNFSGKPVVPSSFDAWKTTALANNAELDALRYSLESAGLEVQKARAGHTPKIDLVASMSKNDSETINNLGQNSTVRSVGVQVNIPLYAGGYVMAAGRQAVATREKTRSDLEAKTNQVVVELRKQFNLTQSSIVRVDALVKSVNSAKLLVEATRQSIKGGVRVNLDLLNAEQQLFTARRDLAQGRYTYLLSYLRLRNAGGVLDESDVNEMAGYFVKAP